MKDTKFGIAQLTNATPAFIGRLRKTMLYITGGIGVFIPTLSELFHVKPELLIQYGGMAVFGLTALCEFFGVPIEGKSVPAKDVTEIETK